jgi:hypothetical protein
MHNVQAADPQHPLAREMKMITDKRKKTEGDLATLDRLKFISGLYCDNPVKMGPYLPGPNFFKALIEAGSITRAGKKIERGVMFLTTEAPLVYDGPRDPDALWGDGTGKFVDRRIVVVNRARIPGIRPIFPTWGAQFEMMIDPNIIDRDEFADIAERAGKIGVGDFRRFYGKFDVKVTE